MSLRKKTEYKVMEETPQGRWENIKLLRETELKGESYGSMMGAPFVECVQDECVTRRCGGR